MAEICKSIADHVIIPCSHFQLSSSKDAVSKEKEALEGMVKQIQMKIELHVQEVRNRFKTYVFAIALTVFVVTDEDCVRRTLSVSQCCGDSL